MHAYLSVLFFDIWNTFCIYNLKVEIFVHLDSYADSLCVMVSRKNTNYKVHSFRV